VKKSYMVCPDGKPIFTPRYRHDDVGKAMEEAVVIARRGKERVLVVEVIGCVEPLEGGGIIARQAE